MAFERRSASGAAYFYLSVRDRATGQVKKVYVGRGPRADAAAAALARRREQRQADRRTVEDAQNALRELNGLMAELDEAANLLLEAALLTAGFHRTNYGPWRRRRDGHGGHRGATPAGRTG